MGINVDGLLAAKDALDNEYKGFEGLDKWLYERLRKNHTLSSDRSPGQKVIVCGETFARCALPFSDPHFDRTTVSIQMVPPGQVVAGTYRGLREFDMGRGNAKADTLDAFADVYHDETARYVQIGDFDLFVDTEGKNRVSLYRNLQRAIRAKVCRTYYPPAQALELVRLKPFNDVGLRYIEPTGSIPGRNRAWQMVKTGPRPIAILAIPESVVALETYGVKWGKSHIIPWSPVIKKRTLIHLAHTYYVR